MRIIENEPSFSFDLVKFLANDSELQGIEVYATTKIQENIWPKPSVLMRRQGDTALTLSKAASKCHKLLAKSRFRISKPSVPARIPAQSQLALLLSKLVTPAERNLVRSSSKDPKYVNVPFIHCSNLISTNINSFPKIWKILKIQAKAKHIYSNDQSSKTMNSLLLGISLTILWEIQNQYFHSVCNVSKYFNFNY